MSYLLNDKHIHDNDSLGSLFHDMVALFEFDKVSPTTFQILVNAAIKQAEIDGANVEINADRCLKSKASMRQPRPKKTSWKLSLLLAAFFMTSTCFIVACIPIFYDSPNDTVVSNFLNHPYVQIVIPKEYGYQLGVFYMNLQFKFARTMRSLVAFLRLQNMIGLLQSKDKAAGIAAPCFIFNPVQNNTQACSQCSGLEEVYYYQPDINESSFPRDAVVAGHIHVFENSSFETSLDKLQLEVSRNLHAVDLKQHSFISNISFVNSADDLGKAHIISRLANDMHFSDAHIVWTTEHYSVSHLMRQVFPRPSLLPFSVAVTRNKAILIDGTISSEYMLPFNKKMYVLYIQGMGSRKIRFVPLQGCVVRCSTHTVVTQAADVLIYDAYLWTAYSLPSGGSSSFAYLAYLIFDDINDDLEEE